MFSNARDENIKLLICKTTRNQGRGLEDLVSQKRMKSFIKLYFW